MALIEELLNMEALESFPFPDDFNPKGWIYVLSNESMPGIYKVGLTKVSPQHRANQLSSSTASASQFVVEAKFISPDPVRDEKIIHEYLSRYRVSKSREFFSCSLDKIISECRRILPLGEALSVEELAEKHNFVTFDDYFLPHDTETMLEELGISSFGSKGNAYLTLASIGAALVRQLTSDGGVFVFTGESFALVKGKGGKQDEHS
ncbi:GIY-YIG nuclease family protein [Enterobacter wuhouensis]